MEYSAQNTATYIKAGTGVCQEIRYEMAFEMKSQHSIYLLWCASVHLAVWLWNLSIYIFWCCYLRCFFFHLFLLWKVIVRHSVFLYTRRLWFRFHLVERIIFISPRVLNNGKGCVDFHYSSSNDSKLNKFKEKSGVSWHQILFVYLVLYTGDSVRLFFIIVACYIQLTRLCCK